MELDFLQKTISNIHTNSIGSYLKEHYLLLFISGFYGLVCGFVINKYIPNIIIKIISGIIFCFAFVFVYLYLSLYPCSWSYMFVPNKFLNMRNSFVKTSIENNENAKILNCKFIKQEKDLCSVTCAEIVLKYYGDLNYNQKQIKSLAENKEYNENTFNLYFGTNFIKIIKGLSKIGYNWQVKELSDNTIDFIKQEIDNNRPVIIPTPYNVKYSLKFPFIDVASHSMVVYGYDDNNLYIIDPNLNNDQFIKMDQKYFNEMVCKHILLTRPKI